MIHQIVSVSCGGGGLVTPFPGRDPVTVFDNTNNRVTPCQAYQHLLEVSDSEILIYVHDDVTILQENWLEWVLQRFLDQNIVAVGLGGATSLGHPDLYKRPYRIQDMARGGYRSNQTDWQVHGKHWPGVSQVVVLDAFFMAVRRDFLLSVGGWPAAHLTHHCLDLWLACEAARAGKETWQVGAECVHHGGGTSVKDTYREARWLQGGSLESDHQAPHVWLYNSYRDVLPLAVGP